MVYPNKKKANPAKNNSNKKSHTIINKKFKTENHCLLSKATKVDDKIKSAPCQNQNQFSEFYVTDNYSLAYVNWLLLWLFYVLPFFQMSNKENEIFTYRAFSLMSFFRRSFHDNRIRGSQTKQRVDKNQAACNIPSLKSHKKPKRKFFNKSNSIDDLTSAKVDMSMIQQNKLGLSKQLSITEKKIENSKG